MSPNRTGFSPRRLGRTVLLVGAAVLLTWLVVTGVQTYMAARSLLDGQARVEALLEDGLRGADPLATKNLILSARRDVRQLAGAAGPMVAIAPYFGWMPRVGSLLENAPELLLIADAGTEAAAANADTVQALLSMIQGQTESNSITAEAAQLLADSRGSLALGLDRLEAVAGARSRLQSEEALPWRVRTLLEQLDAEMPLALDSLRLALILPDILAVGDEKSYLLIAQNEDEMRPTGGYFSGVGLLHLQDGRIVSLDFEDAGLVDDWLNKPYQSPPAPLQVLMGSELFMFRDANYWPDFPRSASEAIRLYSYGRGRQVDGLVAIDQAFLQSLLDVLGPVAIPSIGQTINSDNVIDQMRAQWEPGSRDFVEWMENRKSFMGPLAAAMIERIESGFSGIDPVYLLRAVHAAGEERHLQLFLVDPALQRVIAQVHWDNSQSPGEGDFLQVVDTNVGFNKANAAVSRSTEYRVSLAEGAGGTAEVTVRYTNPAAPSLEACQPQLAYTLELHYQDLVADCYWNYLRVYAPLGSQLTGASSHPVPASLLVTNQALSGEARQDTEADNSLAVFSNFVLVPRGEQLAAVFRYDLPPTVQDTSEAPTTYRLQVKKQAGMTAERFRLVVVLPLGGALSEAKPAPATVAGQEVIWDLLLRTDIEVTLTYR